MMAAWEKRQEYGGSLRVSGIGLSHGGPES